MSDGFPERMFARARELERTGLDALLAGQTAWLEERIQQWPSDWGNDLRVLLYGDFEVPDAVQTYPSLGITVHPEKKEKTIIKGAVTVLQATVEVSDKSIPGLIDAARRINVLLGTYTLYEWGNAGLGWWSWVTHSNGGGVLAKLTHDGIEPSTEAILALPDEARRKVDAALYWVREPRSLLLESYRPDILRVFSAYWNAFECLVDGVSVLKSHSRLSKTEKQKRIDKFLAAIPGKPGAEDIQQCYQTIVNPGFVGRATHALAVCFDDSGDRYAEECFRRSPDEDRLYEIRNAINHGEIDAENPVELIRVEARLSVLWMIVWRMFSWFIPFPAPVDPGQIT